MILFLHHNHSSIFEERASESERASDSERKREKERERESEREREREENCRVEQKSKLVVELADRVDVQLNTDGKEDV